MGRTQVGGEGSEEMQRNVVAACALLMDDVGFRTFATTSCITVQFHSMHHMSRVPMGQVVVVASKRVYVFSYLRHSPFIKRRTGLFIPSPSFPRQVNDRGGHVADVQATLYPSAS